ncbi:MAG: hypothetical protein ACO1NU_09080 [Arcticibacter sp.]
MLLSSCKKDERTAKDWRQLTEAKLEEMQSLGKNIPCDKLSDVSLQEVVTGCGERYFPVLRADIDRFNKLKIEYQRYSEELNKAIAKEGWVQDTMPCWAVSLTRDQPVRLECRNDKLVVITTEDISIAEAKTLAQITYKQVTDDLNAQTCTSASNWGYAALIKDYTRSVQFVPYSSTGSPLNMKRNIVLYNRLMIRIINAEGSGDLTPNIPAVKGVECVNGKPRVQLIN